MKATCLVTPPTAVLLIYGSIHPSLHSVTLTHTPSSLSLWRTPRTAWHRCLPPGCTPTASRHPHWHYFSWSLCGSRRCWRKEEAVAAELQKFRLHLLIGAFPPPPPTPTTRTTNKRRQRPFGAWSAELEEKGEKERERGWQNAGMNNQEQTNQPVLSRNQPVSSPSHSTSLCTVLTAEETHRPMSLIALAERSTQDARASWGSVCSAMHLPKIHPFLFYSSAPAMLIFSLTTPSYLTSITLIETLHHITLLYHIIASYFFYNEKS